MRPLLRQPGIELPVHVQDLGVQHRLWQLQACLHMCTTCIADHLKNNIRQSLRCHPIQDKCTVQNAEHRSNTACQAVVCGCIQ